MSKDLKILISAMLDREKSFSDIEKQIQRIQNRLNPIKLNIDINDKVLSTIKEFNQQMKNISGSAKEAGKVIETVVFPNKMKVTRQHFEGLGKTFAETIEQAKGVAQSVQQSTGATKNMINVDNEHLKTLRQKINAYEKIRITRARAFEQRYGDLLDDTGRKQLDSYYQGLSRLQSLAGQIGDKQLLQRMKNLDSGFQNIRKNAIESSKALDVSSRSMISFGQAMSTALIKFPIDNLPMWE